MEITPVSNSSTLVSFGYDKEKGQLYVEYMKSGLYQYDNVTETEYAAVKGSETPGKTIRRIAEKKAFRRVPEDWQYYKLKNQNR